jgi:hypothetical protein
LRNYPIFCPELTGACRRPHGVHRLPVKRRFGDCDRMGAVSRARSSSPEAYNGQPRNHRFAQYLSTGRSDISGFSVRERWTDLSEGTDLWADWESRGLRLRIRGGRRASKCVSQTAVGLSRPLSRSSPPNASKFGCLRFSGARRSSISTLYRVR